MRVSPRLLRPIFAAGLIVSAGTTAAHAFDLAAYRSRLDATLADVKAGTLTDAKPELARLDEMVVIGKQGAAEYAAEQTKFAKLMGMAVDDAPAMRAMTDAEIEDKWGENGSAGDTVGVPLKTLGQFDQTRAYLELMVGPAHASIFLQKWQAKHKPALLDKVADELTELGEHLKLVH